MKDLLKTTLGLIAKESILTADEISQAEQLHDENNHLILSQGREKVSVLIEDEAKIHRVDIFYDEANEDENNGNEDQAFLYAEIDGSASDWCVHGYTALLFVKNTLSFEQLAEEGIKYTRVGMQHRVMQERRDKAHKAEYKVILADNYFGEHTLINEKSQKFKITLRDFENKTGYINNIDLKTNRLGTTKHIIYLFDYFEQNHAKVKRLKKQFPFIEIFTDPLNDYKISWYFPDSLGDDEQALINQYFGNNNHIEHSQSGDFFTFIQKSVDYQRIKIRPEVVEKIETYYNELELAELKNNHELDFSFIKADLYPYQKEGVEFSVFKKGVIIADEMGLGKTLQAISTAILKKNIFGFKKTLVICPASVKHQWQNEIKKFSDETALIIQGFPEEREKLYANDKCFFHIINYETVLRDLRHINKANYDFVILDEAQKIKNYQTKTANAIKAINKTHALVITGTPIENKLLDLYSIVQFIDINFLAPQWEFSYQHCVFDAKYKNKIHGYYNLVNLKNRLNDLLIRREKSQVFSQLPYVTQKNIFVKLSDEQASYHSSFAKGISMILSKKFKTPHDWQRLMLLLNNMRMVCDSTFLIDKETHYSPKLIELKEILLEKLDIKNSNRKVIIFSEWVTMLNLIAEELKQLGLTFTMLTGKVPVKKRGELIKEFEQNPDCNIFLSSEAGSVGLNLQTADTVINFELPWNPAKKNQRIGRIDRIGQKKQKLNVYNLVSTNSIEMRILAGLFLKQNLFDGVLSPVTEIDAVDFNEKGKSQFIRQLEEVIKDDHPVITDQITAENQETTETEKNKEELFTQQATENQQPKNETEQSQVETQLQTEPQAEKIEEYQQMEEVMTKGMDFLSGIFKMSTGKDLGTKGAPKVNVNQETGEVSITFTMK